MFEWCPNLCQVTVPPDMLDTAEAKWAPADDPVFQLVPLDFEPYVAQCFEDLGKPEVNFKTFWDMYSRLWDLVEITIPGDVTVTLSESIRDNGNGLLEPFALAHLKEPDLGIDGGEDNGNDEGEVPCVDFTDEEDEDELF